MIMRATYALFLALPLLAATACGEKEPVDDTGDPPVDADNDGYDADSDCDDGDPAVHPGAEEVCDGVDNDCDGEIDNGAGDTWYPDTDADGYGDAAGELLACEQPTGFVEDDTDCDDTDGEVHPGAPERCNGVDDDCDGDVDDDPTTVWYSDVDGDGYGNAEFATNSCDPGSGWVADDTDCDDTDAAIFPGAEEVCNEVDDDCDGDVDEEVTPTWYADADGDGYGDAATTVDACEPGSGWVADDTDCDDSDAVINPGATEVCNEVDDDCDGDVDDDDADVADQATWYLDGDADGYGLDTDTVAACFQPTGYAAFGGDCDDADTAYNPGAAETDCADPNDYNCDGSVGYADDDGDGWAACEECDDGDAAVFPGADELCNGADDDCDGTVDEDDALDAPTWYADADGDGYGDAATTAVACAAPSGFVGDDTDCVDTDAAINPGAAEVCDTIDNDCDGDVDDDDAGITGQAAWYADGDGDGYGDVATTLDACFQPSDYVADDTDCDDTADTVNPGATEYCDGEDDDCDGTVDEDDAADALTWYADMDVDGYGDAAVTTQACAQPSGFVAADTDCDDHDDDINPAASELCNGVDDDCDGTVDEDDALDADTWYADTDTDGYGDASSTAVACAAPSGYLADDSDCDDTDAAINPAATETCDGVDNDCDGFTDDDDSGVTGTSTWYADGDGDGFGAAGYPLDACVVPSGYVGDATDCDDVDASIHPGADEYCDGDDNDCDGDVDEDDAVDATTWYADADSDGYGDAASTTATCYLPTGYVADDTDCDDTDGAVNPGATESCNGTDDDCDGTVDEDDAADALTWYADADSDSYGDAASTAVACSEPSGYLADDTDCDDTDSAINPAAAELCDGVDNDCDGDVDDDDAGVTGQGTWYADADADGYGEAATSAVSCFVPSGYVADDTDCDDTDASEYPGADEHCDGDDDDCDGTVDEDDAMDAQTWYADADADGYGDAWNTAVTCYVPSGFVADATDCNDADAGDYPGADEYCDGVDNDCDGSTDELGAVDGDTVYVDADGDTWGDPATVTTACSLPSGYVEEERDCDDTDATIYPYAGDLYGDGEDGDCDGYDSEADWYDSESYFSLIPDNSYLWADASMVCQGIGYDDLASVQDRAENAALFDLVTDSGLGSSSNFFIGYNDLTTEGIWVWADGMSGTWTNWSSGEPNDLGGEDCGEFNGTTGLWNDINCGSHYLYFTCELRLSDVSVTDDDGDGLTEADGDCDDADSTSYPGATELCDGVDNDCDVDVDEDLSDWYLDSDSDGYGDAASSTSSCAAPTGYVADDTDCDDSDASVHPGATEIASDGVDNDCDGLTDEDGVLTVDGTTYSLSAGTYAYDGVQIINGGTLFVDDQVVIETVDFTVDSTSYVDGEGAGDEGGASYHTDGSGTGGGSYGTSAGAGGGGYGGSGGLGGHDSSDSPGAGGSTYGDSTSMSILPGSGGGCTAAGAPGGNGGAALEVIADTIAIAGTVSVAGESAWSGSSGQLGGGGSGGGVLLVGDTVAISGLIDASGGDGGSGVSTANDGGGGGGGGRIKVFYVSSLSVTGSYDVSGGAGGLYGSTAYGDDGDDGTTYEGSY